jgi:hypothetical protein
MKLTIAVVLISSACSLVVAFVPMATTTVTTRFSNINNNHHHRMTLDMAVTDDNTHSTSPTKKTKLVLKVSEHIANDK